MMARKFDGRPHTASGREGTRRGGEMQISSASGGRPTPSAHPGAQVGGQTASVMWPPRCGVSEASVVTLRTHSRDSRSTTTMMASDHLLAASMADMRPVWRTGQHSFISSPFSLASRTDFTSRPTSSRVLQPR